MDTIVCMSTAKLRVSTVWDFFRVGDCDDWLLLLWINCLLLCRLTVFDLATVMTWLLTVTRSVIRSLTRSVTRSLTRSVTRSITRSVTRSVTDSSLSYHYAGKLGVGVNLERRKRIHCSHFSLGKVRITIRDVQWL